MSEDRIRRLEAQVLRLESYINILRQELSVQGNLLVGDTPHPDGLTVGANDTLLTADSTQPLGVKWQAPGSSSAITEAAQDAVGTILLDSSTINFTYDDATPTITGIVIDDSISNAKLRNSGALSVVGRSANSSGDPADISAVAASDAVLRESGNVLGFGTIATAGIAGDAVTNAKLADMAQATVKGRAAGAGTGDPTDLTATQVAAIVSALIEHHNLSGLTDDDHLQYPLLDGRSGGQTLLGGTAANDDLVLEGTDHATKTSSYILLQPSGGSVGVGTSAPPSVFTVTAADTPVVTVQTTDTASTGRALVQMYRDSGSNAVGWDFGFNIDQSSGRFDIRELSAGPSVNYRLTILKTTGYVGINTTTPQGRLQVDGTVLVNGDDGGVAGMTGFTDQFNSSTSSGTGTVKMCGATNRNSDGFLKFYIGTTAVHVPYWVTITG
jgi:hypothetical protein